MRKLSEDHYVVDSGGYGTPRFSVIRPANPYPPAMGATKARFWVDIPNGQVCAAVTAQTMREVAAMLLTVAAEMDDMEAKP